VRCKTGTTLVDVLRDAASDASSILAASTSRPEPGFDRSDSGVAADQQSAWRGGMTRIQRSRVTCRVCGAQSKQTTLLSSNTLGLPDLDGRPFRYSMLRETMSGWVQRCPECGYCAMYLSRDHEYDLPVAPLAEHEAIWIAPDSPPDLLPAAGADERQPFLASIVRGERYRAQLRDRRFGRLANSFLCQGLIDEAEGRYVDATLAAVHAAWVCDDTRKAKSARNCRQRAARLIRNAPSSGQSFGIRLRSAPALLVDVLRRSGDFEGAESECRQVLAEGTDVFLRNLAAFQLDLIKRRDGRAHSLLDAIRSSPEAWGVTGKAEAAKQKRSLRFWSRWTR
jgi:hypothetical protein